MYVKRTSGGAALALMCALLAGCGIAFGDAPEGNDFFVSIAVSGDRVAGIPLTAAVGYETIYPTQIEIVCELRRGSETLRQVGSFQTPAAAPNLTPEDDALAGNFSIDFTIDTPGDYKVECYTPAEEANFIIEEFTVRGE
jgi:hypothetical protein